MGRDIRASLVHAGDTILVFNGRRRQPRKAKVNRRLDLGGTIQFQTSIGNVEVPTTAMIRKI